MEEEYASCTEESEEEHTIHGFNDSKNETTIEIDADEKNKPSKSNNSCEGSDSGVEVVENAECCGTTLQRTDSSHEIIVNNEQPPSCDSSIISCYSNYDEAFNLLVRRNSTLLDDYKLLRSGDGTSENGSESSSVVSQKNLNTTKRTSNSNKNKRVPSDKKMTNGNGTPGNKSVCRTKPPITPRTPNQRSKSTDKSSSSVSSASSSNNKTPKAAVSRTKAVPESLPLIITAVNKKDAKKPSSSRASSQTRSNLSTPDDGRWPSSYSKPAPSMTRSLRGILPLDIKPKEAKNTLEKYATLPRRRKDRGEGAEEVNKCSSRESSVSRVSLIKKQSLKHSFGQSPIGTTGGKANRNRATKTKIYHEIGAQTALNLDDVEKALQGIHFNPANPQDVEKHHKDVQVEISDEKLAKLEAQLASLTEKHEKLREESAEQCKKLSDTEQELKQERLEKEGLRKELKNNNERIAAMLGADAIKSSGECSNDDDDSLMALESRLKNVTLVIIKQEEEISRVNEYCRSLEMQHDKTLRNRDHLSRQLRDFEAETKELQEFMQMEKNSLAEELRESEAELRRARNSAQQQDKEVKLKEEECKHLARSYDLKRQENLGLQARYTALEAKCRELLVHQGSTVSGAAVALTALVSRLEGLIDELVNSYNISDQELDDVIYHNEVYSNSSSSPDAATPEKARKFIGGDKSPSPKRGSSFVAAVIGAIKNATAQTAFRREMSRDNITDNSDNSAELLDSETEPCLMMEHVLEDVVLPDSHSVNMISSGHMMSLRMTRSDEFGTFFAHSLRKNSGSLSELCSPLSLVDQVIEVDNIITRLLKVIRIIQLENEDYINELQDERDNFCSQVNTQRDTNKIVVKQLKDWESLGAKLKCEVKELLAQLSKKNVEIEDLKIELNAQRKEVEKLNGDVCTLSTELSKTEMEMKRIDEQTALKSCEEMPSGELLGQLIQLQREIPVLGEKLREKEKQLSELTQEYMASRQVLSDSLKEAVNESKRQYNAIDKTLETLHSIQPVVQQCPTLVQLQIELEEISFQSASMMPLVVPADCNANAALLHAVVGNIAAPINSSA